MKDPSLMSEQTISKGLRNATSSRALEGGAMHSASQGGQMIDPSGQGLAPANPSPSQEKGKGRKTRGTSGRSSSTSSKPVGPLSSWENRLRQRLERIGSTECVLTWKESATPAGRLLFRLVPSTRPIEEIDCGLWPTARAQDAKHATATDWELNRSPSLDLLHVAATRALWPTPTSRDHFPPHTPEYIAAKKAQGHGMSNLNDTVAMWATPMAHEARLGYQRRMGDTKGTQKSLTTEAVDALGLGENTSGFPVPTEKRGALNPQFVCWLMGFPPEWDASAPTEMPSSRKSRQK